MSRKEDGRQQSSRPGRGGRQQSTPRDQGRSNRTPPANRSSGRESGGSAARHYSNLGGRTPIGVVGKKRVQAQEDCIHQTVDWRRIYVEGLPKNCTNAGREGIPKLRAILEDILDWPLKDTTDYILAETVALQRYHTEHGRGNHATYGIILELGKKLTPEGYELTPRFGTMYERPCTRQRARCISRKYTTDRGATASTGITITAVPDWMEPGHLHDSWQSILVVELRGAPICASASSSNLRCMEAEAYLNRFIRIAEEFMEDVIRPIQPHPELVYIFTQLDYQPTEGPQQPVAEMILQVRMHLNDGINAQQAPGIVAIIQGKLGITAPLYSAAWMVQGVRMEAMGRNARRSHPPHGIFYGQPGLSWPIPQGIIRDIPNTFYRPDLLEVLPTEVLQVLAGYMWIPGNTPGYVTWDRETQSDTLVLYFMPTEGTANPCIWLPTQTLVDLGRSSYAPARMEQVEDVINMTRLRTRATPTQPAPIPVYKISDTDSTGTPLSGWSNNAGGGGAAPSAAHLLALAVVVTHGEVEGLKHTSPRSIQCHRTLGHPLVMTSNFLRLREIAQMETTTWNLTSSTPPWTTRTSH